MAPREGDDFSNYKRFGCVRVAAKPSEFARTTALLGRPPRAYADYHVQGVADRAWSDQPSCHLVPRRAS
jgi:hypothetical protein